MFTCLHDGMSSLKGPTLTVNCLNKASISKSVIIYLSNYLEQFSGKLWAQKCAQNSENAKSLVLFALLQGGQDMELSQDFSEACLNFMKVEIPSGYVSKREGSKI